MIPVSRLLVFILLCAMVAACGGKKEMPDVQGRISADSVILPEKMVLILADVHTVEGAMLLHRNEGLEAKNNPEYYYQGIFRKYHITRERYDQSLKFYRQNPENYAKMYEKVILMIENRQKRFSGSK
ncbi:MAG: DUF4296 domain-containing protein [Bacteroidales bacterium]